MQPRSYIQGFSFFTLIIAIFDNKFNIQNFTFIPMPMRL